MSELKQSKQSKFKRAIEYFERSNEYFSSDKESPSNVKSPDLARRRIATVAAVGAGLLALGASEVFGVIANEDKGRVAVERCVGNLVGREVSIPRNPETGVLEHPRSVFDEQTACEQNNNDSLKAYHNLGHIPLAEDNK